MPVWLSLFLEIAVISYIILVLIRGFRSAHSGWVWTLVGLFFGLPIVAQLIIPYNSWLAYAYVITGYSVMVGITILILVISKKPDTPDVKCSVCQQGEAAAIRKMTLNAENDEQVSSRLSLFIRLIVGGLIALFGIWLSIFAVSNGLFNIGVGLVPFLGISMFVPAFKDLNNRPKELVSGYLYRCKHCKKSFTQQIGAEQAVGETVQE